jgi:RNA polymerase sigma factor (sigma-70 family)
MSARADNADLFAALARARRSRSAVRVRACVSAIVVANSGLVYQHARRWAGRGVDIEDLAQVGMLGLLRAIDTFEPERGHALSTYAVHWIHYYIRREIQNNSATVRTPVHMQTRRHANGERERACMVPLDAPIGDNAPATMLDALPDGAPLPDAQATDLERAHAVRRLLTQLPDGERGVILGRFFEDRTLGDVGAGGIETRSGRHVVSRERVRQIQTSALDRMRSQIASEL